MTTCIILLLLACLINASPFREEIMAREEISEQFLLSLEGLFVLIWLLWGDEIPIKKVMNLRLKVIPKMIQVGGGQGQRTPEC